MRTLFLRPAVRFARPFFRRFSNHDHDFVGNDNNRRRRFGRSPSSRKELLATKSGDDFEQFDDEHRIRRTDARRWRRRQLFHQALREEAGVDEAGGKIAAAGGPPPLDPRAVRDFVGKDFDRRRRGIIAREMATRKYYYDAKPVEDELLTWRAKEQIFELVKGGGEEGRWTPERIARSFPISVEKAKRMLKRKWPPPSPNVADKEQQQEMIRRHDEDVRRRWTLIKKGKTEPGFLTQLTLDMIRSGEVKFLPMFSAGSSTSSSSGGDREEKEDGLGQIVEGQQQQSSSSSSSDPAIIKPDDGPFVRLYKNHLRYLDKSKNTTVASENSNASSSKDGDDVAELRSLLFPVDEIIEGDEEKNAPVMRWEEFRKQLDETLKKRRNRPVKKGGKSAGEIITTTDNSEPKSESQ